MFIIFFILLSIVHCNNLLDPKFTQLFTWLKSEGVYLEGVEIRQSRENMRGVFAAKDFKEGDTLVYVPDHLVVTLQKAKESPYGKIMSAKRLVPGKKTRLHQPTMATMAVNNMQEISLVEGSSFYHHF